MRNVIVGLTLAYLLFNIPSFHDGLFHVYDNVQVTRISAMYGELAGGQFPVSYLDSFGHGAGYFLFKYYSPLVYYLGSLFMTTGVSAIQAVKLIYLTMSGIGLIGAYILMHSITKTRLAASLGSLAFILAPYVYHDFFHRGSLPEASAMMLLPLTIWALLRIAQKQTLARVAIFGLLYGLVILSHTLTGVMAGGMIGLYILLNIRDKQRALTLIGGVVVGMAVAGMSLVPAILERGLIAYENNSFLTRGYLDHPVELQEQWFNQAPKGEKSAYLGSTLMASLLILTVLALWSPIFARKYKLVWWVIGVSSLTLYLMSPSSFWIWERVIYLRYLQFPFRWLTVVTLFASMGYAMIIDYYHSYRSVVVLMALLLFIPLYLSRDYYQTLGYQYGINYSVDDPCQTTTWADEYLSKWSQECLQSPIPQLVRVLDAGNQVEGIKVSLGGRRVEFEVRNAGGVEVAKYYFPEWRARDGTGQALRVEPWGVHGLSKIEVREDNSRVVFEMVPSLASQVGYLLTLLALGGIFWIGLGQGQKLWRAKRKS